MDYQKQYDLLINRAKTRLLEGYVERHHIIPRCIGGDNEKNNIVRLTPEEHFVAHQLLIKMHEKNPSLVFAANMMTFGSGNQNRNNKRYGWLKRKYHLACKTRTGDKNSQYGTCWIYHNDLKQSKKIKKSNLSIWLADGWIKGRVVDFTIAERYQQTCIYCESKIDKPSVGKKYCSEKCVNLVLSEKKQDRVDIIDSRISAIADIYTIQHGSLNNNKDFIIKARKKKIPIRRILLYLRCNESGPNYKAIKNMKYA